MGVQFPDVAKTSAGYYRPTHLCTLLDNKCYTPTDANLPKDFGNLVNQDYYQVNEALKYHPFTLIMPVNKDNTAFYVPKTETESTQPEWDKLTYLASLTEDEVKQANIDPNAKQIPIPGSWCSNIDPCPAGIRCCSSTPGAQVPQGTTDNKVTIGIVVAVVIVLIILATMFGMRRSS